MFFNADALLLANILRGNWQRVLEKDMKGKGKGNRLTPISPLQPNEVIDWLQQAGLDITATTGVRVFNDYLRLKLPPEATAARLLDIERQFCQQEPWWRLGRYILVNAKKV